MSRYIGTHAGCGGRVVAPTKYRYCTECLLISYVAPIELTSEVATPECRECHEVLTDDNRGQWEASKCCIDCEYSALRTAVAAKRRAA